MRPGTQRNNDPKYKTIEGLRTHPLWHQLTVKQKTFLEQYIETGDRIQAIRSAFDFKTDKGADLHATRVLKNYAVKTLLAVYYGYEVLGEPLKRQEFLQLVSDRLRDPHIKNSEFCSLARVAADLMAAKPLPQRKVKEDSLSPDVLIRRIEADRKRAREQEETT